MADIRGGGLVLPAAHGGGKTDAAMDLVAPAVIVKVVQHNQSLGNPPAIGFVHAAGRVFIVHVIAPVEAFAFIADHQADAAFGFFDMHAHDAVRVFAIGGAGGDLVAPA